ncbi:MAG: immunoglobulin domain-containing protein, partial [Firmicutes bacterium]|nr:immunoglobulin domain-containing protein [Bacillota bacterium]
IPDVKISDYYGKDIYKLYRAGVLEGSTDYYNGKKTDHLCKPADSIKRSEVAAILTRMMDPSARKTFSTAPGTALTITSQPKDGAIAEGADAKFTVAVSGGTAPYAYEWHRIVANNSNYDVVLDADETLITGTKTGTLTTKQCAATENGDKYYCVVSNAAGNKVTSQKATLTVSAAALTITKEPSNTSVEVDGTAKFSVKVSGGTEPYTYEWHRVIKSGSFAGDDYALDDNDVFPGASTANLSVKHCASSENGDQYYCIVKDANGNKVTSSKATLTVKSAPLAVTLSPADYSTISNGQLTVTATATGGTGSYTYKWDYAQGTGQYYTTVSGNNSPTFKITPTGTELYVGCTVTSGSESVTRRHVFYVQSSSLSAVSVSRSVTSPKTGQYVTFTATPTGGTAPYTYKWWYAEESDSDWSKASATGDTFIIKFNTVTRWWVMCDVTDSKGDTVSSEVMKFNVSN